MKTHRLFVHTLRMLGRSKLRSGFMMLGSFVGVTALALVVALGEGAERKIRSTVRQLFGDDAILVVAGGHRFLGGPRPDGARMTLDDAKAVAGEAPGIEVWDPQVAIPEIQARYRDASATVRVLGQSERSERVWDRGVTRGEFFDAAAVAGASRVALLGETAVAELFGSEDPLGAEIQIGSVPFRVVGVLERFGSDAHGMDRDDEIVIPISTAMRRLMNVDSIQAAKFLVRDPSRVEETAREVARLLRERHAVPADRPDDFTVITPVFVQQMVARVRRVITLFLPLAAGLSLLVGGVVASALMLGSIHARVGEIGLRQAVGARPQDIRTQFLLETAVTVVAGGVGGIVAGGAIAEWLARRMALGSVLSWRAAVLGLALSAVVGLAAGVVPARRAARLQPADALR